jgi:serine-type D-Ala-D-Ala carboxypeptidase (penicillin-binding protein 5/6)
MARFFKHSIHPLFLAGLALALVIAMLPQPAPVRAAVLAPLWVIVDAETGAVLDHERMHDSVAMASLTKTMTGLLAVENFDLDRTVTIVESDLIGEASIYLQAGEVVTMRTLLHGLMMRSGNDAAMAIARAVGGSPHRDDRLARENFIWMMNQRARELGMFDTSFRNPHGLDADHHYSTAYDLALLTRAAIQHPDFVAAFGATAYSAGNRAFQHTNQLPKRYDNVVGGKTGWTNNAGLCLIEVAYRGDRTLIVILLGSTFERWYEDAIELLDHGWTLPQPATDSARGAAVFDWWRERTDGPVLRGEVERSWLWGPEPVTPVSYESYSEAAGGRRLVQYFDKGRMEINNPNGYINSGWYVTGGLLATELITGRHQVGDDQHVYRGPAYVPVAGDTNSLGPTYADVAPLVGVSHLERGDPVTLQLNRNGQISTNDFMERYGVTAGPPNPLTGHGVASVFDEYLDQVGPVIYRGTTSPMPLFSPRFAIIGLPIADPFWVRVPVNGIQRDVLVQCFERRCLTYTPDNTPEWRVEVGNIGQHYLQWMQRSRIASLYDMPHGYDRWTGPPRDARVAVPPRST